jgi:hypothetical protein
MVKCFGTLLMPSSWQRIDITLLQDVKIGTVKKFKANY